MKVLVVEPGYAPYEKEINGLEEMQGVVGGLITAIYPYEEPLPGRLPDGHYRTDQRRKERAARDSLLLDEPGKRDLV